MALTGSILLRGEPVPTNFFWLLEEDSKKRVDTDEPAEESKDVDPDQQTYWRSTDEQL